MQSIMRALYVGKCAIAHALAYRKAGTILQLNPVILQ